MSLQIEIYRREDGPVWEIWEIAEGPQSVMDDELSSLFPDDPEVVQRIRAMIAGTMFNLNVSFKVVNIG